MIGKVQRKLMGTTIPIVNIHGLINAVLTEKVQKRLKKINVNTAVALCVSVNSPGGLPVQSELICNKLKRFANEHNLKIYTFAHDLAASGGYWILTIGNKVYVDRTSLVGSIGVIFAKSHLQGLLQATTVQHKSISSNEYLIKLYSNLLNDLLNPFKPLSEHGRKSIIRVCQDTHHKFIKHVKEHRRDKLKIDDRIFTGEIYTGEDAVQIGLADSVGSMLNVLQENFPGVRLDFQRQNTSVRTKLQNLI